VITYGTTLVQEKSERLNLRLTKDETKMLDKLAEAEGMTASELIRSLLRGAFAKRFPRVASPFETPEERFARQIFELDKSGRGKR
jgi:mobilization protein NikA